MIVGEKGGKLAQKVFLGLGFAFLYKSLMSLFGLWKDVPKYIFSRSSALPNGTVMGEITPELLGVGYIIGPKIAGIMVGGGILSWLVLIPLITLLGDNLTSVFAPADKLISEMSPSDIWNNYIRYIGAGAVTFGGVVTLIKSFPTIINAFKDSFADLKNTNSNSTLVKNRTEKDIPLVYVLVGSVILIILMAIIPSIPTNLLSSIMIVIFGFFFVTVSSRIVGLIGSSSNPISGMTIATLMATALIFVAVGWTGEIYQPVVLVVGSIVCIASANAGATSQDLKTGYIVGATPFRQQVGLIIGVIASVLVIGFTIIMLNDILVIGSSQLPAPQATLMATVIKGLLSQNLPWGLVIVGMGIAAVMEISGVRSLPFAVGAYLPLSVTSPIFIGGLVKFFIDKVKSNQPDESDIGPGALFSSGLIAGGALTGILIASLKGWIWEMNEEGIEISVADKLNLGIAENMGAVGEIISLTLFIVMAAILFSVALTKNQNK